MLGGGGGGGVIEVGFNWGYDPGTMGKVVDGDSVVIHVLSSIAGPHRRVQTNFGFTRR